MPLLSRAAAPDSRCWGVWQLDALLIVELSSPIPLNMATKIVPGVLCKCVLCDTMCRIGTIMQPVFAMTVLGEDKINTHSCNAFYIIAKRYVIYQL